MGLSRTLLLKAISPHHRAYSRKDPRTGKMEQISSRGAPAGDDLKTRLVRKGHGEGREVPLTREELSKVLNTGKFALVSAGPNPELGEDKTLTESEIKDRHKRLGERLKEGGFAFTNVVGHYGDVENSYLVMVHDADRDFVRTLGKEFKQDSIIYGESGKYELHYTTGEKAAKKEMVEGEGWDEVHDLADYYTEFRHPDGAVTKFRLRLNFNDPKVARKALRMVIFKSKKQSLSEETDLKKDAYIQQPPSPPQASTAAPTKPAAAPAPTSGPKMTLGPRSGPSSPAPAQKAISDATEHEVNDPHKDHSRHFPVVTKTPAAPPPLPVEEKRNGMGREPAKGEKGKKDKPKEKKDVKKKPSVKKSDMMARRAAKLDIKHQATVDFMKKRGVDMSGPDHQLIKQPVKVDASARANAHANAAAAWPSKPNVKKAMRTSLSPATAKYHSTGDFGSDSDDTAEPESSIAQPRAKGTPSPSSTAGTVVAKKPSVTKAMTTVSASPLAAKQPPAYLPGVHSPSSPVRKQKGLKPRVKPVQKSTTQESNDMSKSMEDIFKSTVFVADSNDQPHDGGSGQVEPSRAGGGAKENDDIAPLLKGLKDSKHGDGEEFLITKGEMDALELDTSDLDSDANAYYTITKGELNRLGKSDAVKYLTQRKSDLSKGTKPDVKKSTGAASGDTPPGYTPRAGGVHDPRGQELVSWQQGTDAEVAKYIEESGGVGFGPGNDESIRTRGPGSH